MSRIDLSTLEEVDALNTRYGNSYYINEHPAGFISGEYGYVVYHEYEYDYSGEKLHKTSVGRFELPSN